MAAGAAATTTAFSEELLHGSRNGEVIISKLSLGMVGLKKYRAERARATRRQTVSVGLGMRQVSAVARSGADRVGME